MRPAQRVKRQRAQTTPETESFFHQGRDRAYADVILYEVSWEVLLSLHCFPPRSPSLNTIHTQPILPAGSLHSRTAQQRSSSVIVMETSLKCLTLIKWSSWFQWGGLSWCCLAVQLERAQKDVLYFIPPALQTLRDKLDSFPLTCHILLFSIHTAGPPVCEVLRKHRTKRQSLRGEPHGPLWQDLYYWC